MANTMIFDVSGTLWDDKEQVVEANVRMLKEVGVTHFSNQYGTYSGKRVSAEGLNANLKGSAIEMFESNGVTEFSTEEIGELYKKHLEDTSREFPVKPYEGIEKMLQDLHLSLGTEGMYVISAHPQGRLDEDLEKLEIKGLFQEIKGDVHSKTRTIRSIANLRKNNQTVYIGDTESDMIAANEAETIAIGVSYGYQTKRVVERGKPTKILDTVIDLHQYLKSII